MKCNTTVALVLLGLAWYGAASIFCDVKEFVLRKKEDSNGTDRS